MTQESQDIQQFHCVGCGRTFKATTASRRRYCSPCITARISHGKSPGRPKKEPVVELEPEPEPVETH